MITRKEMVAAMADGIFEHSSECPEDDASNALDALLELLEVKGCQIVPKVATEKIEDAYLDGIGLFGPAETWIAMLTAAPKVPSDE
jgi:hypothetical protein